jgi:hypothetical protein
MSADSPNQLPPTEPNAAAGAAKPVRKRSGKVIIPAVLLILVGLLNLVAALVFVAAGYGNLNANPADLEREMRKQNPDQVEAMRKAGWDPTDIQFKLTFVLFGLGVLTALMGIFVLIGGSAMLRSRGYFGAVFGSLVALISPGGGCLLGLIAGIWALVVLRNPEVRQTFR